MSIIMDQHHGRNSNYIHSTTCRCRSTKTTKIFLLLESVGEQKKRIQNILSWGGINAVEVQD